MQVVPKTEQIAGTNMIKFLLCLSIGISSVAKAEDCDTVFLVKKGETINCDGFFFSDKAEAEAETDRSDAKYYKIISDKLQERSKLQVDENAILEQRLKLYMDDSHTLSQDIAKRDNNETIIRIIYHGAGILVTGLAARNFRN